MDLPDTTGSRLERTQRIQGAINETRSLAAFERDVDHLRWLPKAIESLRESIAKAQEEDATAKAFIYLGGEANMMPIMETPYPIEGVVRLLESELAEKTAQLQSLKERYGVA